MQSAREMMLLVPMPLADVDVVDFGIFRFERPGYPRRYEQSRDRLVDLGYFFHNVYNMDQLPDEGDISERLFELIGQHFPPSPHCTVGYPTNTLIVWDVQSRRPEWDAFVKEHNVPDFRERFMQETGN